MNATDLDRATAVISPSSRQAAHEEGVGSDFRLLIDGKPVEGSGTLDVINPATGRILTTAPRADRAQLEQAVAAAKGAFPDWSATPLNAGTVWVNKHLDVGLDTPFAGAKQSGIGVEMGQEGLEAFTQATIINMAK
jgi:acyl-CoA reductase-like NAD-dependent aldehyde dehydrogenase